MENKTVYKVEEVRQILGVSKNTLYDMINEQLYEEGSITYEMFNKAKDLILKT